MGAIGKAKGIKGNRAYRYGKSYRCHDCHKKYPLEDMVIVNRLRYCNKCVHPHLVEELKNL